MVSPSDTTDAAAASAPGGTSNESERFRSIAASSASVAGDGIASAETSCLTPRVMRRFLASDLRAARSGAAASDSRSAAENANSSVVSGASGLSARTSPPRSVAFSLSAATAAASSAARFAATSSVTLPMGKPSMAGLFSADAKPTDPSTASSSSSASARADKPGTAAVMSPGDASATDAFITSSMLIVRSPGWLSSPKSSSSSSSSASADKPGTAAVMAPAAASGSSPASKTSSPSSSSSSSSTMGSGSSSVGSRSLASSAARRIASRY